MRPEKRARDVDEAAQREPSTASHGWLANFGAQALSLVSSLLERLIVVGLLLRFWGADVYAGWAVLLSAAGTLSLADLGMALYFGNLWQKTQARGETAELQRALGVSQFLYLALVLVLVAGGAIALGLDTADALAAGRIGAPAATIILALLGAATVLRVARGGLAQLYRGHRQFARGILIDLAGPCAASAAGIVTALAGWSPTTLAALYLLCEITLGTALMRADLRRRFPTLRLRPIRPDARELEALLANAPWFGLLQGASVALLQAPVLILGATRAGAATLVGFVLARTLVNLARQIVTMLSLAFGVETAHDHHRGETESVVRSLFALGRVAVATTVAGSAAILLLGEGFVALWTGRPELFDRPAAAWLCAGAIVAAVTTPLATLLTLVNEQKPAAIAAAAQTLTMIVATLLLAPAHGGAGAGAGLLLGELVGAALVLTRLARRASLALDCRAYAADCLGAAAQTAAWMSCVALAVGRIGDLRQPGAFIAAAGLTAALGVAPALLLSLPETARARALAFARPSRSL
jgi:O-antigen/teichoic acid export membrane protein